MAAGAGEGHGEAGRAAAGAQEGRGGKGEPAHRGGALESVAGRSRTQLACDWACHIWMWARKACARARGNREIRAGTNN